MTHRLLPWAHNPLARWTNIVISIITTIIIIIPFPLNYQLTMIMIIVIIIIMIIVILTMVISIERLLTGWLLPLNYQLMQLVKKIFAPKEVKLHYGSFPDQNENDNNDNDN